MLVTGHTGFKGSWLALWLSRLGAQVTGYSVDIPTQPSNFDATALADHLHHTRGDVRDRRALEDVIDSARPNVIFHLAAQSLVRRSYADPVTTFETNAIGTLNLLESIRSRPWIEAAVIITSDKAYRNDEWCWGYRETDALGGRDPYSGSKSCADLIVQSYFHSFLRHTPTRVAITRAGNVIGGGDWAQDRIVPDCIKAWTDRTPVTVRSPDATRPWQHVLEPLSGYLLVGAQLLAGRTGVNGEAFNFGPDATVNETVAQLISAMAERWPGASWQPEDSGQHRRHEATLLKLSCDKALFYLRWRATLTFAETVRFTVDWYRAWFERRTGMYTYSAEQIDRYCQLARERRTPWAEL